jgi:hypothetical protein
MRTPSRISSARTVACDQARTLHSRHSVRVQVARRAAWRQPAVHEGAGADPGPPIRAGSSQGRVVPGPGRIECCPTRRTAPRPTAAICADAGSRPPSRKRTTRPPTGVRRDPTAAGHPGATRSFTSSVMPWSAASTSSNSTGLVATSVRQARRALRSHRPRRLDQHLAP